MIAECSETNKLVTVQKIIKFRSYR